MSVRIITGDALTELAKLPAESVHCCVTSPPYYGLRDYGTATWEGGDPACDHRKPHAGTGHIANSCPCGARRIDAQLGLEPTPDAYIAAMVGVFREVRRVLRRDGTLWLNIGDSYAATTKGSGGHNPKQDSNAGLWMDDRRWRIPPGIKPKDLIGIPWMLAFALRADGWYLRQDIIWAKPNPMPESVTDRCTKAHEYLFLLSKSERYYFEAEAIAEEGSGRIPGNIVPCRLDASHGDEGARLLKAQQEPQLTRNKRSVWAIATAPFPEAHFATFPPALVEPCVKAGCPRGGTVLDPFLGAGTTALVADRLGRDCIGIELNPEYAAMAKRRVENDAGLFASIAAE